MTPRIVSGRGYVKFEDQYLDAEASKIIVTVNIGDFKIQSGFLRKIDSRGRPVAPPEDYQNVLYKRKWRARFYP